MSLVFVIFFFFKQKTAYEMRIIDWSSDVCSSVLFLRSIALGATVGDEIRLSHAFIQPIAAEDVADAVTAVALAAPVNGKIELGGPEKFHIDEIVAQTLALDTDTPPIVVDPDALYAGVRIDDDSLIPAQEAECGSTHLKAWLETASPPRNSRRFRIVPDALGRRRSEGLAPGPQRALT